MRIGILGTGDVAKAIGTGFVTLGHDVKMSSRDANNEKAAAYSEKVPAGQYVYRVQAFAGSQVSGYSATVSIRVR